jgi:hypothetical protein
VPDATSGAGFARPGLTVFARIDELGLEVTGQRLEPPCGAGLSGGRAMATRLPPDRA